MPLLPKGCDAPQLGGNSTCCDEPTEDKDDASCKTDNQACGKGGASQPVESSESRSGTAKNDTSSNPESQSCSKCGASQLDGNLNCCDGTSEDGTSFNLDNQSCNKSGAAQLDGSSSGLGGVPGDNTGGSRKNKVCIKCGLARGVAYQRVYDNFDSSWCKGCGAPWFELPNVEGASGYVPQEDALWESY